MRIESFEMMMMLLEREREGIRLDDVGDGDEVMVELCKGKEAMEGRRRRRRRRRSHGRKEET